MPLKFNITTENLKKLIDTHMGPELLKENNSWEVLESPLSGRGIFAVREIAAGEVILRDIALTVGPTNSSTQTICVVCYKHLEGNDPDIMCKNGCTLPLCGDCSNVSTHSTECELFRRWKPKETTKISPQLLRFVSIVRCLFLSDTQRRLLLALQANNDKYYVKELEKVAAGFTNFPSDRELLEYFQFSIAAFNTNAFEGNCHQQMEQQTAGRVRALFPLASLMNHQCTPNADHYFENPQTLVIYATRRIERGEEIVTSYTKLLWSSLMRKMFLKMTKHFECCCPRCLDPT
ncbi:SET domain-containing protein SmydA-8-like, partial [Musca vetustissima]|uniref:SET domain-containing protein SmydA-8-like n=1 Tax=Musca vetustissima TaxID=27455 RepID=UPI002AB77E14